jgi:hypothetical protein
MAKPIITNSRISLIQPGVTTTVFSERLGLLGTVKMPQIIAMDKGSRIARRTPNQPS